MAVTTERSAGATTIRPFTVEIPEADLEDLRARIAATRFPEKETVEDDSQGVPLALDAGPRALLGDRVRLAQVRGAAERPAAASSPRSTGSTSTSSTSARKHEDALPLIVCHGWPGSIVEQLKLIGPLTDPTAHGGERVGRLPRRDPVDAGLRVLRQADQRPAGIPCASRKAYVELMKRLGYTRFVAQGGDWGAVVVDAMAGGRADPAAASRLRRSCSASTPTWPA